jgi:hypothetical protein
MVGKLNKKAVGFGGILGAVVILLIASHFIIAQDQLAKQYSFENYQTTVCPPVCATGSVLDPATGNAPNNVNELDIVTSTDNIIDQTADATQSPIFPGGSESMELVAFVTKVDSLGNRVTEEVSISLPTLSVVLDPETGFDISTGFIETDLLIKTEPLSEIVTTGIFNYLLNGVVVETFAISDVGRTNSDGERIINGNTPIDFSFEANVDIFTEDGLSEIVLQIESLEIIKTPDKFGIVNADLYTAQFFKSDVITKITNEEGGEDIIFPIDDQIKICAQNGAIVDEMGNAVGSIPSPPMGKVDLTRPDGTVETIFQGVPEGTCDADGLCESICTFTDIARNSFYELEYFDPIKLVNFSTPISQKNYYFECHFVNEMKNSKNCSLEP